MPITDQERLEKLENSHIELKEGQLKMEMSIEVLTTTTSKMVNAVEAMSTALKDQAITAEVVSRLEDDIHSNRTAISKLEDKLEKQEDTFNARIINVTEVSEVKSKEQGAFSLKMALGATGALWGITSLLFGYLYMDQKDVSDKISSIERTVSTMPVEFEKHNSKIDMLEQKVKYCSGELLIAK